jgi:hypothetical protein
MRPSSMHYFPLAWPAANPAFEHRGGPRPPQPDEGVAGLCSLGEDEIGLMVYSILV